MFKDRNFISQVQDFSIFKPGAFQDCDMNDKSACKKLGLEYESTGLYVFFALIGLPFLFIPTIIYGIKAYRAHCFNCKIDTIKTAIIENQQEFQKQQAQQANTKANNSQANQKENQKESQQKNQINNTVAKVEPVKAKLIEDTKENTNPNVQTKMSNNNIIPVNPQPIPKQETNPTEIKTEKKDPNQNADDIKTN